MADGALPEIGVAGGGMPVPPGFAAKDLAGVREVLGGTAGPC